MAVPEISVDELAGRLDAGAFLLDVRQPDEYGEAHVPGARLIPLDEVPERVGELPPDTEILVICRSGAPQPPRGGVPDRPARPRRP